MIIWMKQVTIKNRLKHCIENKLKKVHSGLAPLLSPKKNISAETVIINITAILTKPRSIFPLEIFSQSNEPIATPIASAIVKKLTLQAVAPSISLPQSGISVKQVEPMNQKIEIKVIRVAIPLCARFFLIRSHPETIGLKLISSSGALAVAGGINFAEIRPTLKGYISELPRSQTKSKAIFERFRPSPFQRRAARPQRISQEKVTAVQR